MAGLATLAPHTITRQEPIPATCQGSIPWLIRMKRLGLPMAIDEDFHAAVFPAVENAVILVLFRCVTFDLFRCVGLIRRASVLIGYIKFRHQKPADG